MINILESIQKFKGKDNDLYQALFKCVKELEDQNNRITAVEKAVAAIENYCTGCFVYSNASQLFTSGFFDTMLFEKELFDGDNLHDNATNNSRITIKESGFYLIYAQVETDNKSGDSCQFRVAINTGTNRFIDGTGGDLGGGGDCAFVVCAVRQLQANTYLEAQFFSAIVGGNTILTNAPPMFGVYKMLFNPNSGLAGVVF